MFNNQADVTPAVVGHPGTGGAIVAQLLHPKQHRSVKQSKARLKNSLHLARVEEDTEMMVVTVRRKTLYGHCANED